MNDPECVEFLQWALPRLHMRWAGLRKIRRQVCKRIARRIRALRLDGTRSYRGYLETHPREWRELDALCRVPISRFYRDPAVFAALEREVLPALAVQALARGGERLRAWSAGCASGEEPYTLALLWELGLKSRFPQLQLHILATDTDRRLLARAGRACYTFSSVKHLPAAWLDAAFRKADDAYCLEADCKRRVEFRCSDIRDALPEGRFHLILCRNLVFTYFDAGWQRTLGERLCGALKPGGALVVGSHETLPQGLPGLEPWPRQRCIYRRRRDDDPTTVTKEANA